MRDVVGKTKVQPQVGIIVLHFGLPLPKHAAARCTRYKIKHGLKYRHHGGGPDQVRSEPPTNFADHFQEYEASEK
jgi:hypothetical protein